MRASFTHRVNDDTSSRSTPLQLHAMTECRCRTYLCMQATLVSVRSSISDRKPKTCAHKGSGRCCGNEPRYRRYGRGNTQTWQHTSVCLCILFCHVCPFPLCLVSISVTVRLPACHRISPSIMLNVESFAFIDISDPYMKVFQFKSMALLTKCTDK